MSQANVGTILVCVLAGYFLPTLVALARGHMAKLAIFLANLLFGWTLIGWAATLIWAANSNTFANRGLALRRRIADEAG